MLPRRSLEDHRRATFADVTNMELVAAHLHQLASTGLLRRLIAVVTN
jgi:hypothetical protein